MLYVRRDFAISVRVTGIVIFFEGEAPLRGACVLIDLNVCSAGGHIN